jgi:hypothetical protein
MDAYESGISKRRAFFEATYPTVAILLWVWFEPVGRSHSVNNLFIAVNVFLLFAIIRSEGLPTAQEAGIDRLWRHHATALIRMLPFVTASLVVVLFLGGVAGVLTLKPHFLLALLSYPIWALLQDAIVFVYVLPRARIVFGKYGFLYVAILFAVTHLPSPVLTIASLILIVALNHYWKKFHSLFAIAIAHGLIGAVCNKTLLVSMRIGAAWFAP